METKNKKTILKIFIITIVLSCLMPIQRVSAWDALPANIWLNVTERLQKTIDSITLTAAKQAAVTMILEEVDKFVGDMIGTASGLITNWEDYLKRQPEERSKKFMNDYLSGITQGRNSSRFRSVPVSKTLSYYQNEYEGFGAKNEFEFALIQSARAQEATSNEEEDGAGSRPTSYESDLALIAEEIANQEENTPQITCTDDMRNNMFEEGNLNNFWECTEGINNPVIAYAHLETKYQEDLAERKKQAEIKSISPGVTGSETPEGQTKTPAASIIAQMTKAQTIGMDILASSRNVEEVISATVVEAINRSIQQGIGAVKDAAQRQISNVRRQITNNIKQQARQIGPQAVFKNR